MRPIPPALALSALALPAAAQIHLTQSTPCEIGTPMTLVITGATPSSPISFTGSPYLLDPPAAPGTLGLLYVGAPRVTLPIGSTNGAGSLTVALPVPSTSALLGLVFPMQAVDVGAIPDMDGSVFSNPLAAWFGPHPVKFSPAPEPSGGYGYSVAIGDFLGTPDLDIAVGAVLETVSGAFGAGRVHVYAGPSFTTVTTLTSPAPQIGGDFGWSLCALDWNGDGATDLAVGEPGHDGLFPLSNIGAVNVFLHPVGSGGVTPYLDPTPTAYAQLGISVAAGDLDATPEDELVVGAPYHGATVPAGSLASVLIFSYAGGAGSAAEVFEPNAADGLFGESVALGDVDGDGFDEILVGEPEHDEPGATAAGAAHLIDGGAVTLSLLDDTPAFGEKLGTSVAIGDLDGDGLGDLLVGVLLENDAQLYLAPAFSSASPIVLAPAHPGDIHGGRAVAVGDVNGDGKLDALVAAGSCTGPGFGVVCGSVTAYLGHALAATTYVADSDFLPWSLAAGDFDGDGLDEILVGHPGAAPSFVSGAGAILLSE